VIDIAGLVKGAASGAGLGNAFLSHIKAVDAIYHVVRAFDEADVIHVEGELEPLRDMEIIREELRLKDEEFLTKQATELSNVAKRLGHGGNAADKAKKEEAVTVNKVLDWVKEGKDVRHGTWTNKEIDVINGLHLITAKPVIYLANLSEKDFLRKKNKWLPKIKTWIDENSPGDPMIPYSGAYEYRIALAESADEKAAIQKECNAPSVLPKVVVMGYSALKLIYYFTGGPDEVRAWTIRKSTKAPGAAGVIHTDFERGFIMAEVMKYDDLKELGSENAVKANGKYSQKGKEYVVEDGDIIYFKFNVTAPAKKK
jgi:obg-like ATPase 1